LTEPEKEHDPSDDECSSRRTVQLGVYAATDLKCVLERWRHSEMHRTSRYFGDVLMTAAWPGEFEEP
jgi:hypothetical protein